MFFTQKSLLVIYTHHFFVECLTDIISVNKLLCGHVYADKQHNYEHTRLEKKNHFLKGNSISHLSSQKCNSFCQCSQFPNCRSC